MFFQIAAGNNPKGDFFPLAQMDFVRSKGDKDLVIAPLKNDRDPAREKLHLVSVGPASQGSATISADPKLKDRVIYSPAAAGRRSATIPYVVADESGRQSTGTIWFRGNAAGTYRDEGMLTLRVKPDGSFTAAMPEYLPGLSFSGSLDSRDSASVSVPYEGNRVFTLRIALRTEEGLPQAFTYVLRNESDGFENPGTASLIP